MLIKRHHYLLIVSMIGLLSGCDSGSPRPAPAPIPTDAPSFTANISASDSAGIISITLTPATVESQKHKSIIGASRPFTFGGMVTTSTVGGGKSSADYDVTYCETVAAPTSMSIPFVLKNESPRALTLNGVVMRVKSDVEGVQGSMPKEITNDTKLAPGETIAGTMVLDHLDKIASIATVTIAFYEIPMEVLDNGQIGKRGSIVRTLTVTKTAATLPCSTYTLREARTWMDGGHDDPALREFMR